MSKFDEIVPLKFGVHYRPAELVLLYEIPTTGKRRRRRIPLKNLSADSNVETVMNELLQEHSKYIGPSLVSPAQVHFLFACLAH